MSFSTRKPLLQLFLVFTTAFSCLLAQGDLVIPQLADGGRVIRTRIDITNLSGDVSIKKVKLLFFHQNGDPWTIDTNHGTDHELNIQLGANERIQVVTSGRAEAVTAGYGIIRSTEPVSSTIWDYKVGVSTYYEFLSSSKITDAISVPLGENTTKWAIPVTTDLVNDVATGFAIVNLADSSNWVELQLWQSDTDSTQDAIHAGATTFSLAAGEQRARFLHEAGLFPGKTKFSGTLKGESTKPVAILGLMQMSAAGGNQYAIRSASYLDTLHRDNLLFFEQTYSLDADIPLVNFLPYVDDGTHDLCYWCVGAKRNVAPRNGAQLSIIGQRTRTQFNDLNIGALKALTYRGDSIDMTGENLAEGFTFAVKTNLGRYAKVRIWKLDTPSSMAVSVYTFR